MPVVLEIVVKLLEMVGGGILSKRVCKRLVKWLDGFMSSREPKKGVEYSIFCCFMDHLGGKEPADF